MGCVAASQAKHNLIKLPSTTSSCTTKSANEPAIMLQTRQISLDALRGQTSTPNLGQPMLDADDVYEDNDAENAEMENEIHHQLTRGEIQMDVHQSGAFEISADLQRKLTHKNGLRTCDGQNRSSHTTDDDGSRGSPDYLDLLNMGDRQGDNDCHRDDDYDDAGRDLPRDLIRSLSAKRLERYCVTAESAANSSMKSPINDEREPARDFPKEDHGSPHVGEAREENGNQVGSSKFIRERSTTSRGQIVPNATSTTGG